MVKNFRRELMMSISFIAGSALIFGIAVYFLSDNITVKAQKISSDRASIGNRSELIGGLAEQKASSPEVKKFQQQINLILPVKDDLVNYQSWLDGLSRVHQVSINFQFSGETAAASNSSPGYIKFILNANGDYTGLTNFIKDVEYKDARFTTKFDTFDLKRSGNDYNISVDGKIYFR